jgi:hypothetical protein
MASEDWADKRAQEWLADDYEPAKWHPIVLRQRLAALLREVRHGVILPLPAPRKGIRLRKPRRKCPGCEALDWHPSLISKGWSCRCGLDSAFQDWHKKGKRRTSKRRRSRQCRN